MVVKKVKLDKLVPDKNQPRKTLEEIRKMVKKKLIKKRNFFPDFDRTLNVIFVIYLIFMFALGIYLIFMFALGTIWIFKYQPTEVINNLKWVIFLSPIAVILFAIIMYYITSEVYYEEEDD